MMALEMAQLTCRFCISVCHFHSRLSFFGIHVCVSVCGLVECSSEKVVSHEKAFKAQRAVTESKWDAILQLAKKNPLAGTVVPLINNVRCTLTTAHGYNLHVRAVYMGDELC